MANLIPQLAKKRVTLEYWLRVVTAWFLLWTVALLIGSVLLFPVYIFTQTQVSVNAESAQIAEESVASFEAVAAEIKTTNDQAKKVIEDSRQTRAYQYIALFESFENNDVSIAEISFAKSGTTIEPISISGQAADRESLAAFREQLLEQAAIESVDLPISNLAKDRDIQFDITVTMSKKADL